MVAYKTHHPITPEEFTDVLNRSTLGERRPVDDPAAIEGMVRNADITITAWDGDKLVGVARSVTDFTYCCYLSDLAVDSSYQRRGIGVELMALTQSQLGPGCKIILLAAPSAADYYLRVGFEHHPRCWTLDRNRRPSR
ncbi:MAG: GNAT family N-acetyltransferase [Candidatus Promineofilum sp.]|nr:GNAT family N-acetyltransferase [Promineifilum sp.]